MIQAILVLGILGFLLAIILSFASKKLKVKVDPKEEEIMKLLPGANCGACGFPGCSGLVHALLSTKEEVSCPAGGSEVKTKIASILGIEAIETSEKKAVVKCRGSFPEAKEKFIYDGLDDCKAANLVAEGRKSCVYGCIGLGTCIKICPFGAITRGSNHLPVINNKCTGCGKCIKHCPKKVISLEVTTRKVYVLCNSNDKGTISRKNCKYACIGCSLCVKQCEFDAIKIENNLAKIDSKKCTNCKKCVAKCPTKALVEISN